MKIGRDFKFEAAHFLPNHKGKCKNMHGHSYKLRVWIDGKIIRTEKKNAPSEGMVLDYSLLKEIVEKYVIEVLDHKNINEVLMRFPTAENMCYWIFDKLWPIIKSITDEKVYLDRIELKETDKSYAVMEYIDYMNERKIRAQEFKEEIRNESK